MKCRKGHKWVKNVVEHGHTHLVNIKTNVCVMCHCKIGTSGRAENCKVNGKPKQLPEVVAQVKGYDRGKSESQPDDEWIDIETGRKASDQERRLCNTIKRDTGNNIVKLVNPTKYYESQPDEKTKVKKNVPVQARPYEKEEGE